MEKQISVVIPAYNEEGAIGGTLDTLVRLGLHEKYEVIIINDGSTDKTAEVVRRYPVTLCTHSANKGYGAGLKTGIRKCKGEKVIILDSDGQHNPEYIDKIAEMLDEYEMVIGERTQDSFQVKNRTGGKKIIRMVGEYLVEQDLPDFNSGFRGFRTKDIRNKLHMMPNGFSFSTTSTLAFLKEGLNIGTFPIVVAERVGRKSNVKFIKDGSKTMLLLMRIIMLFNPLKIFFPLSVFSGIFGFVWGVWGIIDNFKIPNGSILLLVTSVAVLLIGLIADQVSLLNRK